MPTAALSISSAGRVTALLPSFVSKECPPLIEIPDNILQQVAESVPLALQSYVRLHSIEPGEGIVGTVWRDRGTTLPVGR